MKLISFKRISVKLTGGEKFSLSRNPKIVPVTSRASLDRPGRPAEDTRGGQNDSNTLYALAARSDYDLY